MQLCWSSSHWVELRGTEHVVPVISHCICSTVVDGTRFQQMTYWTGYDHQLLSEISLNGYHSNIFTLTTVWEIRLTLETKLQLHFESSIKRVLQDNLISDHLRNLGCGTFLPLNDNVMDSCPTNDQPLYTADIICRTCWTSFKPTNKFSVESHVTASVDKWGVCLRVGHERLCNTHAPNWMNILCLSLLGSWSCLQSAVWNLCKRLLSLQKANPREKSAPCKPLFVAAWGWLACHENSSV